MRFKTNQTCIAAGLCRFCAVAYRNESVCFCILNDCVCVCVCVFLCAKYNGIYLAMCTLPYCCCWCLQCCCSCDIRHTYFIQRKKSINFRYLYIHSIDTISTSHSYDQVYICFLLCVSFALSSPPNRFVSFRFYCYLFFSHLLVVHSI